MEEEKKDQAEVEKESVPNTSEKSEEEKVVYVDNTKEKQLKDSMFKSSDLP